MNVDRLIQMVMRQLMRKGMNKGIDMASRRGKRAEDMTPDEQTQAKQIAGNARKMQRGMRAARRIMK